MAPRASGHGTDEGFSHRDTHPRWCGSCRRQTGKGPSGTWSRAGSGLPCGFMSRGLCGEEGCRQQTVRGVATPVLCSGERAAEVSPAMPLRGESQPPLQGCAIHCCLRAFAPDLVWKGGPGLTASRRVPLLICCSLLSISEF